MKTQGCFYNRDDSNKVNKQSAFFVLLNCDSKTLTVYRHRHFILLPTVYATNKQYLQKVCSSTKRIKGLCAHKASSAGDV